MKERATVGLEARVLRLERQNRIQNRALIVSLCAALALGSIAVSNAQPTVITASEVRAQHFALLDSVSGEEVSSWYTKWCTNGRETCVIKP